jgi:hypothetical protein
LHWLDRLRLAHQRHSGGAVTAALSGALGRNAPIFGDAALLEVEDAHQRAMERFAIVRCG